MCTICAIYTICIHSAELILIPPAGGPSLQRISWNSKLVVCMWSACMVHVMAIVHAMAMAGMHCACCGSDMHASCIIWL